jgi:glycine cleavage system H lipoate-binding protein
MSILFVLLTFLLIMTITYFLRGGDARVPAVKGVLASPQPPQMSRDMGFQIPRGYFFHPGHTWAIDEGDQNVRIGLDGFAASLIGNAERIEVAALNRWVRQGQKIWSVTFEGKTIDMLSPVEGVLISVNQSVQKDPNLALKDPYKEGWLCVIKAPEINTNLKNLVQGPMVAPWMQGTLARLSSMTAPAGAAMQDGGQPVNGLLNKLEPELQRRVVREFFLT